MYDRIAMYKYLQILHLIFIFIISRLNKRRSASMSFLERAEHLNLGGSGWSVGHDPKAGTDDNRNVFL